MVLVDVLVFVVAVVVPVVLVWPLLVLVVMVDVHVRVGWEGVARRQTAHLVLHWVLLCSLAQVPFKVVGEVLSDLQLLLGLHGAGQEGNGQT